MTKLTEVMTLDASSSAPLENAPSTNTACSARRTKTRMMLSTRLAARRTQNPASSAMFAVALYGWAVDERAPDSSRGRPQLKQYWEPGSLVELQRGHNTPAGAGPGAVDEVPSVPDGMEMEVPQARQYRLSAGLSAPQR
ncbi:MAG: hypothetical protein O3A47_01070 [Chloroflexi bacterium]|nr:hypothetical protein [Chloroflexota bacterium]